MRAMLALLILVLAAPTAAADVTTRELDAASGDCIPFDICIDEREGHWGAYLCITQSDGDLLCLEALQFVDRIIHG